MSQNVEIINFPADLLIFQDKIASKQFDLIINNKIKPYEFYRDQKNSRHAISLQGIKNLVIDGKGAIIQVRGMVIPFYLENCDNITLRNFTIQYETLTHTEGIIIRRNLTSFDVHLSKSIDVEGTVPIMAWIEYDTKTLCLGKNEAYPQIQGEILDRNTIRVLIPPKFQCKVPRKGKGIILRHIITHHSGIQLFNCKNITIRNVEVNEAYWGALLAHRVENLTVDDFRVKPREGRIFSTNADACHVISCSGLVKFENCYFEGHGDDALNVHTLYYSIKEILNQYEMIVRLKIEQQDRIMDYPDEGDVVEFANLKTLKPYGSNELQSVKIHPEKKEFRIRFKEPIPKNVKKNDVMADRSKVARVIFRENHVFNNRARGILIQSRDVLIENNKFSNCTGTGIYITCSKYWWEAISSENVRIINNKIKDCGGGPGTNGASGISITTEATQELGTHKNILVSGNKIHSSTRYLPDMRFESIEGLTLKNNNYSRKIKIKKCRLIEN